MSESESDNTITVTLCEDPLCFGDLVTDIYQVSDLKRAWRERVEETLAYLVDAYEVEVRYGSRARVDAPDWRLEERIRNQIESAWDAWCADGIAV